MKELMVSLRMFLFWTVVLGLGYPLLVTGAARILAPNQASGAILTRGGQAIGSRLIAQKFETDRYFWGRPSAVDYNPLPSGGSNLGPTSEDLRRAVQARREKLMAANPGAGEPPSDLLFTSASGLDPEISPDAALYQVARVAGARNLTGAEVRALIDQSIQARQFGILGEPRVNVLELNLALDARQGLATAPTPAPIVAKPPEGASAVPAASPASLDHDK